MYKAPTKNSMKILSKLSQKGTVIIRTNCITGDEDFMNGDTTDKNFVFNNNPHVFKYFSQASRMLAKCNDRESEKKKPQYEFRTYILGT